MYHVQFPKTIFLFQRVVTDNGLEIFFDGDHRTEIHLAGIFKGTVAGLCGNYDGNKGTDWRNPIGLQVC